MLATFAIEIIFALYILWRYKFTAITRLIVSLLVLLAVFQAPSSCYAEVWRLKVAPGQRLAMEQLRFYPPLGIHLAYLLANKSQESCSIRLHSSVLFFAYCICYPNNFWPHMLPNYVTFNTANGSNDTLYNLLLWLAIRWHILTYMWAPTLHKHRKALYALMTGIWPAIPTTTVTILWNKAIAGIPSIMCGFAVILAGLLTLKVAPENIKLKTHHSFHFKLPFNHR